MKHPSHETKCSVDSSIYDEICIKCGAHDIVGAGWGNLELPCPKSEEGNQGCVSKPIPTDKIKYFDLDKIDAYTLNGVKVEAIQLCWKNWGTVCDFLGDVISEHNPGRYSDDCVYHCEESKPFIEISIPHVTGMLNVVRHGDWIVKHKDVFIVMTPASFNALFEKVNSDTDE